MQIIAKKKDSTKRNESMKTTSNNKKTNDISNQIKKIPIAKKSYIKINDKKKNNSKILLNKNNSSRLNLKKEEKIISNLKEKKTEEKIDIKTNNFIESEMNSFSYEEAKKFDKRSYFKYYLSLIKTRNLLIFSFYQTKDFNSQIIKISLFFFSFGAIFIINALFFIDKTMHQIYTDQGIFNFVYSIPQIINSSLIFLLFLMLL